LLTNLKTIVWACVHYLSFSHTFPYLFQEELAICEQQPAWDGKEFCRRWAMRFANELLAGLSIKSEEEGAELRKVGVCGGGG
jgi:hypothetical protein